MTEHPATVDSESPHPTRGLHVLADLWGCDPALIDDRTILESALRRAADAGRATVLEVSAHRFEPQGVTAIALLAESHLAIHTWPEHGYVAVDVLSCGTTMRPYACVELLKRELGAAEAAVTVADRGIPPNPSDRGPVPRTPDLVTTERPDSRVEPGRPDPGVARDRAAPRWFTERELPHGRTGVTIGVEIADVLHDERSPWGHIQVFDTPFHGRMLVIDGVIQTTENDEFVYHEMLVLPPSIQHGGPETMLIIGGGDGGALRQALRLRSLERVVQVEIDDLVTKVSREYLPGVSGGAFDDPRVELVFADGAEYVAARTGAFDVIVLDLTDPISGGPAEPLFGADFLGQAKRALAPGGVLSMQCGSLTFQPDEVTTQVRRLREVFAASRLHTAVVPGYQLTTFGFLVAADRPLADPETAEFAQRWRNITGECAYLSPEMFRASAAIPPYLRRTLQV